MGAGRGAGEGRGRQGHGTRADGRGTGRGRTACARRRFANPGAGRAGCYSPGVDEHQRPAEPHPPDDAVATDPPRVRRQPGEPRPYVEERRPPNLWLLVMMTAIALVAALGIMALTLL